MRLTDLLPDLNDPNATSVADRARELLDPAAIMERQLESVRAEAYAAGQQDATARLTSQAQALAAELAQAMGQVSTAAADAAAAAVRADATDLAEAAWLLASWAIGRELTLDPTTLTGAVSQALTEVPASASATVYTHPDTVAALTGWASTHTPHRLDLAGDPALAPGEIRVVTDVGSRIEATVSEIGRRALARLVSTVAAADTGHETGHGTGHGTGDAAGEGPGQAWPT